MSFKIIDPGYGVIFTKNGYDNGTPVKIDSARCGVACHSDGETMNICAGSATDTLYIKFDMHIPESDESSSHVLAINVLASNRLLQLGYDSRGLSVKVLGLDESESIITIPSSTVTVWVGLEMASYGWYATVRINGDTFFEEYENEDYTETLRNGGAINFTVAETMPISNIIISSDEINLTEIVVEVGSSAVETTMDENDGAYSSARTGDYVLQTLDTTSLYGLFDSESTITTLLAVAAPAYTTGEDVTQVKCRKVDGDTMTDYVLYDIWEDPVSLRETTAVKVAEDGGIAPAISKLVPVDSGTTLASLNGLKIGWVTA